MLSRHSAIFQKRDLCHCGSKSFTSIRSLELPFCCCLITKSTLTLLGPSGSQPTRLLCPCQVPLNGFSTVTRICSHVVAFLNQVQVSLIQSLSHVQLFGTPWIAAHQASLSITNSWSSLKLTTIESVMPSSHLILCRPLLLLPPIPPSIRVFSKESTLRMRWPKYWCFSLSISLSNEHPGLVSFRMDWLISLQSKGLSRVFSNTTVQKHQFFSTQLSLQSNSHIHTWPLEKP